MSKLDSVGQAANVGVVYIGDDTVLGAFGVTDCDGGAAIVQYRKDMLATGKPIIKFAPECFHEDGCLRADVAMRLRPLIVNSR